MLNKFCLAALVVMLCQGCTQSTDLNGAEENKADKVLLSSTPLENDAPDYDVSPLDNDANDAYVQAEEDNSAYKSPSVTYSEEKGIPCPYGWSVKVNPSLENSLTYSSVESSLAVSVTAISPARSSNASAEDYARVASQQMKCDMPGRSNLIEDGWTFNCAKEEIEAVVYGSPEQLVLLAIAGRKAENEEILEGFVKFLAFEAKNK
ncbi:MAG: hypothetical protein ACI4M9_09150 [Succinivibrio sp.]